MNDTQLSEVLDDIVNMHVVTLRLLAATRAELIACKRAIARDACSS